MTFSIYAVPALLALLTKAGIFIYDRFAKVRNVQSRIFLAFLVCFAIQNLVEVVAFANHEEMLARAPAIVGRAWYSATILVVALLFHLALVTATNWHLERRGSMSAFLPYAPVPILLGLLWGSSLLIVRFEPMTYTITKVPGPLFFMWEMYVLGYSSCTVGLLIYGALRQMTIRGQLQSKLLLLGVVPLVLLLLGIIGLQRFVGFRTFNAAATLPLTSTILIIVAAYAIYHYRLLDVAFYVPWSKARRHKAEFYKRIQAITSEIGKLSSPVNILEQIANALRCRVTLLGGPRPWIAEPRDQAADDKPQLLAEFPGHALRRIERTVTADEVAQTDPELHEIMKRYKVGAIVPFKSYSAPAGYCLLLDRRFNEEIYSSLDFKVVDRLFSALAQRFFEDFLLVRSQLHEVQNHLNHETRKLVRAEQTLSGMHVTLNAAKRFNRDLRAEVAQLRRENFKLLSAENVRQQTWNGKTLHQFLAEREREAIISALRGCSGNRVEAARVLGMSTDKLDSLIERHRLQSEASPVA